MNNDNEIINEFNATFEQKPVPPVEPYRVTQNNTTFNDVNNINNNIQDNTNFVMPDYNTQSSENLMPEYNEAVTDVNQTLYDTTNYINNKPIENKTKKATIKINPELKTAIVIALILLVAMSFIPTIFDFLNDLKLKIFG